MMHTKQLYAFLGSERRYAAYIHTCRMFRANTETIYDTYTTMPVQTVVDFSSIIQHVDVEIDTCVKLKCNALSPISPGISM